jgi:hypothetical protein
VGHAGVEAEELPGVLTSTGNEEGRKGTTGFLATGYQISIDRCAIDMDIEWRQEDHDTRGTTGQVP